MPPRFELMPPRFRLRNLFRLPYLKAPTFKTHIAAAVHMLSTRQYEHQFS